MKQWAPLAQHAHENSIPTGKNNVNHYHCPRFSQTQLLAGQCTYPWQCQVNTALRASLNRVS